MSTKCWLLAEALDVYLIPFFSVKWYDGGTSWDI